MMFEYVSFCLGRLVRLDQGGLRQRRLGSGSLGKARLNYGGLGRLGKGGLL